MTSTRCLVFIVSSSRSRGRSSLEVWFFRRERFIPACAGPSSPPRWIICVGWVHPRLRGAVCCPRCPPPSGLGSSPRARGGLGSPLPQPSERRFIPACAGPWSTLRRTGRFVRVHPRECGAACSSPRLFENDAGSSPSVRGRHPEPSSWSWRFGLIPSALGRHDPCQLRCTTTGFIPARAGPLPPQSWRLVDASLRFIPARAGPLLPPSLPTGHGQVHPRVRWAALLHEVVPVLAQGSSLRARGRSALSAWRKRVSRSIPACAGAAVVVSSSCSGLTVVHSPRARGGYDGAHRPRPFSWFIPACAGPFLLPLVVYWIAVHLSACAALLIADLSFGASLPSRGGMEPHANWPFGQDSWVFVSGWEVGALGVGRARGWLVSVGRGFGFDEQVA